MQKNIKTNRIWEIDFLRGIAFFLMMYDHIIYDLNYVFFINTNFFWGYDYLIGDTSARLFMILCGISATLSKNTLKHGIQVFGYAMILTVITNLIDFFGKTALAINFGILHLLGISLIISVLVKKLPNLIILALSVAAYFIPNLFKYADKSIGWLFPLGIYSPNFYSSDYYPIFPFIAFIFLGIFIGKILYKNKKSLFNFNMPDNFVMFIGRNSLIFYVCHQPIILILLYIILKII